MKFRPLQISPVVALCMKLSICDSNFDLQDMGVKTRDNSSRFLDSKQVMGSEESLASPCHRAGMGRGQHYDQEHDIGLCCCEYLNADGERYLF